MNDALRATVFFIGLLFAGGNVYLLSKRKMTESMVIAWGFVIMAAVFIAIFPNVVNRAAFALGVSYPPALLFLIVILGLLTLSLHQSVKITALEQKVQHAGQLIAIIQQQLNQARRAGCGHPGRDTGREPDGDERESH